MVKYSYDAFGNCNINFDITSSGLASINPIRYRGYYFDVETKLYYLNARYYNPEWRRFISPASAIDFNPKVVNGLNLYVYANNNPIDFAVQTNDTNTAGKFISSIASTKIYLGVHRQSTGFSFNLKGAITTFLISFGYFDQLSGYVSVGLESGVNYLGLMNLGGSVISHFISAMKYYGISMAVASSILSFGDSVYCNFNNINYTNVEAIGATVMDLGYYTLKGVGSYFFGSALGSFAVEVGLTLGVVSGGVAAVAIGLFGAIAAYLIWEEVDSRYERAKEKIFG